MSSPALSRSWGRLSALSAVCLASLIIALRCDSLPPEAVMSNLVGHAEQPEGGTVPFRGDEAGSLLPELRSSKTVERLCGAEEDFSGGEGWCGEDILLKINQLN